MADLIHHFMKLPDTGVALMARTETWTKVVAKISDVTSIAYTVHDTVIGVQTDSGSLVVADVFSDTLQTDSRWTPDLIGYNFRWDAPESITPLGGKTYQVLVELTMAVGAKQIIPYLIDTLKLYGKA